MPKYCHPTEIPRSKSLFFDWIGDRIPVKNPNVKGDTHPLTWADDGEVYRRCGYIPEVFLQKSLLGSWLKHSLLYDKICLQALTNFTKEFTFMSKSPFDQFPSIHTEEIILRKILPTDIDLLFEIYSNERLFCLSPNMLKKNKDTVANMIGHFERDFNKKKIILLGICLPEKPDELVGVAEMFDYDRDVNMITIGYRLNDRFWGQGIATKAVRTMVAYLFNEIGVNRIQAFVMPENVKSLKVLERNNFLREGVIRQGYIWKGKGVVDLVLFSMIQSDYCK